MWDIRLEFRENKKKTNQLAISGSKSHEWSRKKQELMHVILTYELTSTVEGIIVEIYWISELWRVVCVCEVSK